MSSSATFFALSMRLLPRADPAPAAITDRAHACTSRSGRPPQQGRKRGWNFLPSEKLVHEINPLHDSSISFTHTPLHRPYPWPIALAGTWCAPGIREGDGALRSRGWVMSPYIRASGWSRSRRQRAAGGRVKDPCPSGVLRSSREGAKQDLRASGARTPDGRPRGRTIVTR